MPEFTVGSLVFATEAAGGEDEGWSIPQPLRAMAQSSPIPPRLRQAPLRMTLIDLVCHGMPHPARRFRILTVA